MSSKKQDFFGFSTVVLIFVGFVFALIFCSERTTIVKPVVCQGNCRDFSPPVGIETSISDLFLSASSCVRNCICIDVPPVKAIPKGRPKIKSAPILIRIRVPEKVNQTLVYLMMFIVDRKDFFQIQFNFYAFRCQSNSSFLNSS